MQNNTPDSLVSRKNHFVRQYIGSEKHVKSVNPKFDYLDLYLWSDCIISLGHCCDQSPAIPQTLRLFINQLEERMVNWEYLYHGFHAPKIRGLKVLKNTIDKERSGKTVKEINAYLSSIDVAEVAIAVKLFLYAMDPKPFRMEDGVKDCCSLKTCLGITCPTLLHTTCFLMIHLLHCLEYSNKPRKCLHMLAETFDPLIFQNYYEHSDKKEEGSMMSLADILNQTNYKHWYEQCGCNLAMRQVFRGMTPQERVYFSEQGCVVHDVLHLDFLLPRNPHLLD